MPKPPTKKLKTIPAFRSEDAEQKFWSNADSTEYFDLTKAKRAVFPKLKPSRPQKAVEVVVVEYGQRPLAVYPTSKADLGTPDCRMIESNVPIRTSS